MTLLKYQLAHVMIQVKGAPLITTNSHVLPSGEQGELRFNILDLAIKLLSPQGYCIAQVRRLVTSGCGSILFRRVTRQFVPDH